MSLQLFCVAYSNHLTLEHVKINIYQVIGRDSAQTANKIREKKNSLKRFD